MKRALILGFLCTSLSAAPTWEIGNSLAKAYRAWASLRNIRVSARETEGTLSVPEIAAWREVKTAWRTLEKSVEQEYGK